ncbi:MAG: tetratricopeptide repeat protein [Deltaproteobacteria bacterium]|nr:tetratricopeptide repeat protein [Deltaproteobacteria bacterium]
MSIAGRQVFIPLFTVILLTITFVPASFAAASAQDIASFADSLFEEEDYYRAITEYKRLIHLYPETDLAKEAGLKVAIAYMEGKRFRAALSALEKFRRSYGDDPLSREALFLKGEAWFAAGNYEEALRVFKLAGKEAALLREKNRAYAGEGRALMKMGRWKEASATFEAMGEVEQGRYLRLSRELEKGETLPGKSPSLAGTLSAIIPGAGQLYVGRKRDALVSFLLNGAFIAGAAEAFRKGEDAIGGILLFFEAGWYAGNIYSAAGGAHKYNKKARNDFVYSMERKYSFGADDKGNLFGIYHLRF